MTKKVLVTLYLLLVAFPLLAQTKLTFDVVSFEQDQMDLSAQSAEFDRNHGKDQYAIIKVKDFAGEDDLQGFTFDFGTLNCIPEWHEDELWLCVQRNAKSVTIKRPGYKTIEKYDLHATIQAGRVYVLTLNITDRVQTQVVKSHHIQSVKFVVTSTYDKSPIEGAVIKIKKANTKEEYAIFGASDINGTTAKPLDPGQYDYTVTSEFYKPSSGRLTLKPDVDGTENVSLVPNFGYLEVQSASMSNGADIYVTNASTGSTKRIGTVPFNDESQRWECGQYTVTITKDLYKDYTEKFSIEAGVKTTLTPILVADFAETTLRVDADAEIWVDGQLKGKREWKGPLKAGKYTVECRQGDKYYPTTRTITVKPDEAEIYTLDVPKPITGSIWVNTVPSGATIKIDGETYREATPATLRDVIIGEHTIELTLKDHKNETCKVVVEENKNQNIDITMKSVAMMNITSKPAGATLYINNKKMGTTPFKQEMPSGDYAVKLEKYNYHSFEKKVHFDSSNPNLSISLNRQYMQQYGVYLQPAVQVGSSMAVGANVGGYISNINIEASYMQGLTESEQIFWNKHDSSELPLEYYYKSTSMGGKVGYGIILSPRMRLTPQVGAYCINLKASYNGGTSAGFDPSKGYAVSAVAGLKFECALITSIGLFVQPEYTTAIKKSEIYKHLEPLSPTVKGFASGVNVKAGVSFFF